MVRFDCDYCEGAHPRIIERLAATNMEQTALYGADDYCAAARRLIKKAVGREEVDIHFLVGGTQTNTTIIASVLKPYEGVVAAVTGHIGVHETGAIEATGHKVLTIPSSDGKITASQVEEMYEAHINDASFEHMVKPGMVYISQPTETGALYSLAEIKAIGAVCRRKGLLFYVDGARLGYGLASPDADFTLADLAEFTDVFYIGGTKVGALFGEAVVIVNDAIKKDFRYNIKQHGGMLAKGRLLGLQFETLFSDDLYYNISAHAIKMAIEIREVLRKKGVPFLYESSTNQQFPIIKNDLLDKLQKKYVFDVWCKPSSDTSAVRICTSWATREENVEELLKDLSAVL
jgi:threonine aldolase